MCTRFSNKILVPCFLQAEDITLTIGQAFDLAYRRFLETSGKDLEVQRRLMVLTQRVKKLETENVVLRQRLTDISQIKGRVSLFHQLLLRSQSFLVFI